MMNYNNVIEKGKTEVQRETVAVKLIDLAGRISDLSSSLHSEILDRLSPIIIPFPQVTSANKDVQEDMWPPLFTDLRDKLNNIERYLYAIREIVHKTEI